MALKALQTNVRAIDSFGHDISTMQSRSSTGSWWIKVIAPVGLLRWEWRKVGVEAVRFICLTILIIPQFLGFMKSRKKASLAGNDIYTVGCKKKYSESHPVV
jgi:hypothetical protein